MRIEISDDLADELQAEQPKLPLAKILTDKLKLTKGLKSSDRLLILSGKSLRAVEELCGLGSTVTPEALVTSLQRKLTATWGGAHIPFSPAELTELAERAARNRRTLDQEIQEQIHIFYELLFYGPKSAPTPASGAAHAAQ